jgi:hypothetical protein
MFMSWQNMVNAASSGKVLQNAILIQVSVVGALRAYWRPGCGTMLAGPATSCGLSIGVAMQIRLTPASEVIPSVT